jgi:hypothetical protein
VERIIKYILCISVMTDLRSHRKMERLDDLTPNVPNDKSQQNAPALNFLKATSLPALNSA